MIELQRDERDNYTSDKHNKAILRSHQQYGESDNFEQAKSAATKWLGMDHLESGSTADKLIGGELWVKTGAPSVRAYASKTIDPTKAIKTYKSGSYIGIVESFVTNPNMLMTIDKQFVPIDGSTFDGVKMEASLARNKKAVDEQIAAAAKLRMDANKNPLYTAGKAVNESIESAISFAGSLKWYILGAGVLLSLVLVYKITK